MRFFESVSQRCPAACPKNLKPKDGAMVIHGDSLGGEILE